jgi:hypothetical protein
MEYAKCHWVGHKPQFETDYEDFKRITGLATKPCPLRMSTAEVVFEGQTFHIAGEAISRINR